jgi:hypothetical protein
MIPLCQDEIWGGTISMYWNKSWSTTDNIWVLLYYCFKYLISNTFNSRSKYKCLHVISPERNKAISLPELFKILSVCENPTCQCIMRAQYKINFDRPPRLIKKLPEALIISPELRHIYKHTYRQTERHKSKSRSTVHNSAKETGHK